MRLWRWALYPLLAGVLAACAGGPSPTATPTLTPSPTPTVTPLPVETLAPTFTPRPTLTAAPPPAGTLRVVAVGNAPHRDPHQMVSEWATLLGPGLVYSRLLKFAAGPDVALPSMEVACDLCASWRIVGPLTYEFSIDPDARWQDVEPVFGRGVTAQDVVLSLERLRTPGWPHASLLNAVGSISAVGASTVRLELRYRDADLPQKLANPHAVIVAAEVAQTYDLRRGPVIGSGPWLWRETLSGQLDLTPAPDYHRPGVPAAARLVIISVPDQDTASASLLTDTADIAPVTEEQWASLSAAGFESKVVQRQGMGVVLAMNTRAPPFDRLEVRRAFLLALDPWEALAEVWDGLGSVGVGVPVVATDWLLEREAVAAHFDRVQTAAQALDGARSSPVTLTVANFGAEYVRYGEWVAERLASAGFELTIETLTRSQYLTQVWQERRFQVFIGPLPPVATTGAFLFGLLHSQGQWRITGYADPELDELIEAQAVELDPLRRGELVRAAQERVLALGLLFMPVITAERWAYSSRVSGFYPNFAGGDGAFWGSVAVGDE